MSELLEVLEYIDTLQHVKDKQMLATLVARKFNLIKDRSVYYCDSFSLRFSSSKSENFSNTVLSLSNLRKYDNKPFIVVLVTPEKIVTFLANSTFIKKVSHSSQELRENNIRGSFNGSDIMKELNGLKNNPQNFDRLYSIHQSIGFDNNLPRLVVATNNIVPTGVKFFVSTQKRKVILDAPMRAKQFFESDYVGQLHQALDVIVNKYKNEILLASLIENINVRGRIIEYLITGNDAIMRDNIIKSLNSGHVRLPQFQTANDLGDFSKDFGEFHTETDVKTKVMYLNSNPKAYNLDKMLNFLSFQKSVFLFYFIGIDKENVITTRLVSMFQKDILDTTITLKHWAGRNSRGVTQFEGRYINSVILGNDNVIDVAAAQKFLEEVIDL